MQESNAEARIVLTTESTLDEANKLGRTLVEERLVACATLLPVVQSIYWAPQPPFSPISFSTMLHFVVVGAVSSGNAC